MKNVKRALLPLLTLGCALLLSGSCSKKNPAAPLAGLPHLEVFASKTVFTGQPIRFIAVFGDGVPESDIIWKTRGQETFRTADPTGPATVYGDTTQIHWNNLLVPYAGLNAVDTVYVIFKSNPEVSNKVVVTLANHSPILDSLKQNGLLIGRNSGGDTIQGVVRLHMNPTVKETLRVYAHDIDLYDSTKFFIDGIDTLNLTLPGLAYQNVWPFTAPDRELFLSGALRIADTRGGAVTYPLEIVVYNEVHSIWAASTYGSTSLLSKLTRSGKKLFTLTRFQQVKKITVQAGASFLGDQSVWVVDQSVRPRTGPATLPRDTVFLLDDDGRVLKAFGGFGRGIEGFALAHARNTAYVIHADTVKELSSDAAAPAHLFSLGIPGASIEAIDVHPFNPGEYWIAVQAPVAGGTRRLVLHMVRGTVRDTLRRGFRAYDSLDRVNSLAVAARSNLYWIGCDSMVVAASLDSDRVIAKITGFHGAYVTADQKADAFVCWVADAGNSRVVRINAKPSGSLIAGTYTTASAAVCLTAAGAVGVRQPRSLALDYNTDDRNTVKTLWIADYDNNRILAVNGTSGASLGIVIDTRDLELENPEAVAVNVGYF